MLKVLTGYKFRAFPLCRSDCRGNMLVGDLFGEGHDTAVVSPKNTFLTRVRSV